MKVSIILEICPRSNAEIKPVSQCYKKYITNRSMSSTVILQLHEKTNSLFPTQKQNTTWTHSFRWLYDFGTNYRLRLRMPQLNLYFSLVIFCFHWNFINKLLNPCHTRVESLQRSHSVLKICRSPRCALCNRLGRRRLFWACSKSAFGVRRRLQ